MSHVSRRSGSCKSFCLEFRAAALAILIFTPAHAEKSAGCTTERIVSHDGWGQVRGEPGVRGRPLWRLISGFEVKYCGNALPDERGVPWHWIEFRSAQEPWPHEGWVSSRILVAAGPPQSPQTPLPAAPEHTSASSGRVSGPRTGSHSRPIGTSASSEPASANGGESPH